MMNSIKWNNDNIPFYLGLGLLGVLLLAFILVAVYVCRKGSRSPRTKDKKKVNSEDNSRLLESSLEGIQEEEEEDEDEKLEYVHYDINRKLYSQCKAETLDLSDEAAARYLDTVQEVSENSISVSDDEFLNASVGDMLLKHDTAQNKTKHGEQNKENDRAADKKNKKNKPPKKKCSKSRR